jgi:arginyl-tRNA synthetase
VYQLYAHARINSIVRKSGRDIAELAQTASVVLSHEKEVALALQIARFSEAVEDCLAELLPHRMTEYLYELSSEGGGGLRGSCHAAKSNRREATAVKKGADGAPGLPPLPVCPGPHPGCSPRRLYRHVPPRPAAAFNQFYTECQVVGSAEEDSRLLLCEATARVMRACFQLLGIRVLYRI